MTVRPTVVSDLPVDDAPWLVVDGHEPGGLSLVEVQDGELLAAGTRQSAGQGPDLLHFRSRGGAGLALLQQLVSARPGPSWIRVIPHHREYPIVLEAGGRILQRVPAGFLPTDADAVRNWCRDNSGPTVPGTQFSHDELVELWIRYYLPAHAGWLGRPLDRATLVERSQATIGEQLDHERTRIAVIDGAPVAAAFIWKWRLDPETIMGTCDAIDRDHPAARRAVAAAIAAVLDEACPTPVEFDGHEDDGGFYYEVVRTVPGRRASDFTPMHMVEFDS